MITIEIDYVKVDKKKFLNKNAHVEHVKNYIDLNQYNESVLFVERTTGEKLIYIANLEHYDSDTIYNYLNNIKINSTAARAGKGVVAKHIQIGFMPGNTLRGSFCSKTSSYSESLQVFGHYMALFGEAEYKKYLPELYESHCKVMEKLKTQEVKISKDSLFTSAVINRSNNIQYHIDSGNTQPGTTLINYFVKGVKGGELIIPELDLAINIKNNIFIIMDGYRWIHGVAPIVQTEEDGKRYSVVYYSKKELFNCSVDADNEKIRANRINTLSFINKKDNLIKNKLDVDRMLRVIKERYKDYLD
jgi:hypothetical protein